MFGQGLFHLLRGNHFAAPFDEVAGAAGQIDVAVRILPGQVAGVKPAVADGFAGGLALPPVAGHYAGAPGHDFPHLAGGRRSAVLAYNQNLDVVQGLADGSETPQFGFNFGGRSREVVVVRRQHSDGGRGFGLPESVDETGVGEPGDGCSDNGQRHWGGAIGDYAE